MMLRRTRGERGSAAVEFALMMPIFLLLLFGIIDFGYMINRSSVVNNASRDAVRVASFPDSAVIDVEAAANATLKGVPGATVSMSCKPQPSVGGTCAFASRGTGQIAVVTVRYQHKMLTPAGIFFPGGFDLTRTAEMRVEG